MTSSLVSRRGLIRSVPQWVSSPQYRPVSWGYLHRKYSSATTPRPGAFMLQMPKEATKDRAMALNVLNGVCKGNQGFMRNAELHDTALVLTSPGLARLVCDDGFLSGLAKTISCSSQRNGPFNLLIGVADRIAGGLNANGKRYEEGLAIYRCNGDRFIPNLWKDEPAKPKEDADAVSVLRFRDFAGTGVTLPLANTLFSNGMQSTLVAAQYDMSGPSPKLVKKQDTYTQNVLIPTDSRVGTVLPLSALTPARVVTQSFGNIVRGIDIHGADSPASTELEDAVERVWKVRQESDQGAFPIYAFVSPESASSLAAPGVGRFGDPTVARENVEQEILDNTEYFGEAMRQGGRFYQLLSGGGGWGKKKGLLSLDPQTSHFSRSDEDELASFFRGDSQSSFAPGGSTIQFFAPHGVAARQPQSVFTFGVEGPGDDVPEVEEVMSTTFEERFGALSDKALFLDSTKSGRSVLGEAGSSMKLSVPGSRVLLATGSSDRPDRGSSDIQGALLADALTEGFVDIL